MKTYANKSNAARACKAANGGTLNGYTLHGEEGAWYYAQDAKDSAGRVVEVVPVAAKGRRSSDTTLAEYPDGHTPPPARKAPAKKAAKKAAPAKKVPAKKAVAKKAPARKAAADVEVYDVKNGPTQGRISGYSIDTDRDTKHGVTRRSAGTIGGRLWAIFDTMSAKAGGPEKLEIAAVKEAKAVAGFNANKVVIEFYYWRRYHGVRGRGRKQKVAK